MGMARARAVSITGDRGVGERSVQRGRIGAMYNVKWILKLNACTCVAGESFTCFVLFLCLLVFWRFGDGYRTMACGLRLCLDFVMFNRKYWLPCLS